MLLETPSLIRSQRQAKERQEKLRDLKEKKAQLKTMMADCNSKVATLKAEILEKRQFQLNEASEKVLNA